EVAGQVYAGLDGETGARDDLARIPRLQVIYVRAVAVYLLADGVARAVREVFAVARALDDPARHVVHLRALYLAPVGDRLAHKLYRRVARVAHDGEYFDVLCARLLAHVPRPSLVGVDCAGLFQLGPNV